MRRVSFIATALLFVAVFALPMFAQTGATPQTGGKIGLIDTQTFLADKVGIARLLAAYDSLEKEFAPRNQELMGINGRLDTLAKDIQTLQAQATNAKPGVPIDLNKIQADIAAKTDEGQRLQVDFKRKQEDAKAAYEKREAVVVGPIKRDIGAALDEYSKQKGFSMVFDIGKMAEAGLLLSMDRTVDMTDDFIKYFNAKPATTATTTAPAAKPPTGTAAKPN